MPAENFQMGHRGGAVYYQWLFERTEKYLGQKILVAGPACDKFCAYVKSKKVLICLTQEKETVERFKKNFQRSQSQIIGPADLCGPEILELSKHNFDTIVCLNALERSSSDSVALQHIHRLLPPEGTAIFLVPVSPWLSKWLDPSGTVRHRYTKKQILQKLDQHRFHVTHSFYYNSFGIFFPAHRTSANGNSLTDRFASLWNRWENKLNFPVGRSLVVVAKTKLPARG